MTKFKLNFCILIYFFFNLGINSFADNISYSKDNNFNKSIHIVEVNSKKFHISQALSKYQLYGLEGLDKLSKRLNAISSINLPFEKNINYLGYPLGINKIYGNWSIYSKGKHPVIGINSNKIYMDKIECEVFMKINDLDLLKLDSINKNSIQNDNILYTSIYGNFTFEDRISKYLTVSNDKVTNIAIASNLEIPKNGYIISLPIDNNINIKLGDKIEILSKTIYSENYSKEIWNYMQDIITVKDIIINNNKINYQKEDDDKKEKSWSAFCLCSNDKWKFINVDHTKTKSIQHFTIGDFFRAFKKAGYSPHQLFQMTVSNIINIIHKIKNHTPIHGLTKNMLAKCLTKQECIYAAILDSGDSNSLFYKDKLVNNYVSNYALNESNIPQIGTALILKEINN